MAKGYWVTFYRSITNHSALAEYASLAGPAIEAGGGRFLAGGTPTGGDCWILDSSGMQSDGRGMIQKLQAKNSAMQATARHLPRLR
jgi:Domain of unknown function (DUF1330)